MEKIGLVYRENTKGWIKTYLEQITENSRFEIEKIPFKDNNSYPLLSSSLTTAIDLPNMINSYDVDLVHILSDNYMIGFNPNRVSMPVISSVHGIQGHLNFKHSVLTKIKRLSLERSNHIIANSDNTRKQIDHLSAPVTAVHLGVNQKKYNNNNQESPISQPYFFHLSNGEKRKNIDFMIKSFSKIKPNFDKLKLVIGGSMSHNLAKYEETARAFNVEESVIFVGWIEEGKLPQYYSNAVAYLQPSKHESFGIPVLEAMSCNTVPIVSENGALPEVVGNAGIVLPLSLQKWSNELSEIYEKPKNDLNPQSRAKNFSWEKKVKEIDQVYSEELSKIT